MRISPQENEKIKEELTPVIEELKANGVTHTTTEEQFTGLGDLVEGVLTKFGITEDRFKEFFNLRECKCKERKEWLNNLFSWHKDKKSSENISKDQT